VKITMEYDATKLIIGRHRHNGDADSHTQKWTM